MNPFDSAMAAGMACMTATCGEPITIDGKVYQAVIDKFHMSRDMREAGFRVDYELIAVVPITAMPTAPAAGTTGVYKGRPIRLVKDGVDTDTAAQTLKFAYAG